MRYEYQYLVFDGTAAVGHPIPIGKSLRELGTEGWKVISHQITIGEQIHFVLEKPLEDGPLDEISQELHQLNIYFASRGGL